MGNTVSCEPGNLFVCTSCDAVATVTSAVELEAGQQSLIAKKLQAMTDANNVKIKPEIDESLLGGFVVRLGTDGKLTLIFCLAMLNSCVGRPCSD